MITFDQPAADAAEIIVQPVEIGGEARNLELTRNSRRIGVGKIQGKERIDSSEGHHVSIVLSMSESSGIPGWKWFPGGPKSPRVWDKGARDRLMYFLMCLIPQLTNEAPSFLLTTVLPAWKFAEHC